MLKSPLVRLKTVKRAIPEILRQSAEAWRSYKLWRGFSGWREDESPAEIGQSNALQDFFAARREGRGIWKWEHYFSAYERHFAQFRGRDVRVLEIGIYSGGSLDMWRDYFGAKSIVYGIDIEPSCRAYEREGVRILIGDQSDRSFWSRFRAQIPEIDIVIDDGSHIPEHQIVALEELLPHLRPNGVYLCEDIHGPFNRFSSYLFGMSQNLNGMRHFQENQQDAKRRSVVETNPLQSAVAAIHLYPYMAVIERTGSRVQELIAPKHGTLWQPFLK